VSERYRIAQNGEMFSFADELIGNGEMPCSYETAGSISNGRRVFMLVNMPKTLIMEDEYQPYLCLSNAHDGSSSLQIFLTGIRVACTNIINAAFQTSKRKISIRHLANMETRKQEAVRIMGAASGYFHDLENFATMLAGKKVNIASRSLTIL
jgi:hypothetical protein